MTKPKDPANHKKRKPPIVVTNRMIEEMQEMRRAKVDLKVIAAKFDTTTNVVIRYTKDVAPEDNRSWKSVKKRRLNYEAIFYDLACKASRADVCAEYGITRSYLKNILHRYRDTMMPAANEKLRADVIAAYADGDPISNIVLWSGRTHNVIRAWVGELPTGKGGNKGKRLDTAVIAKLYLDPDEPVTTIELASRFGCSTPAISYHLRKAGIPVKGGAELRRNAKSANETPRSETYAKAA